MKQLTNGSAFKPRTIARGVMRKATIINMMRPTRVLRKEIQEAGHLLRRRLNLEVRALHIAIGAYAWDTLQARSHGTRLMGNAACASDTLLARTHGTCVRYVS